MGQTKHTWLDTEDQFLLDNYKVMNPYELSKWVNHSEESVESRLKKLGLYGGKKHIVTLKRGWTQRELDYLISCGNNYTNRELAIMLVRTTTSVRKMRASLKKKKEVKTYDVPYRRVMREYLGRQLKSTEHVHHIDLDKTNNDISNLYLCKTPQCHGEIHAQLNALLNSMVKDLMRYKLIKFKDGKYYISSEGTTKLWLSKMFSESDYNGGSL